MKKVIWILAGLTILYLGTKDSNQVVIPKDAIRFRVIANSDTKEDQALKHEVKKEISPVLNKVLKNSTTKEETLKLITNVMPEFETIVSDIVTKQNQTFHINYGMNYFPEKTYKGVKYESGYYESLVITLGDGKGENWWCVLFPPLCLLEAEEQENKDDVEYQFLIKELLDQYL